MELSKVNYSVLKQYEMHLISKGYSETHIKKSVRYVKSVVAFAVNKGLLEANHLADYQFEYYPKKAKEIVFLSQEECNLIFSYPYGNRILQETADLLWFQCLTSFAYTDAQNFDYKKHTYIDDGEVWVRKHREKETGTQVFPLDTEAIALLKKYNYQLPKMGNAKFNVRLKEIAQLHNIEKKLITHIGRTTFISLGFLTGKYTLESMSVITGDSPATLLKYYGKLMPQSIKNDRENYKKRNQQ